MLHYVAYPIDHTRLDLVMGATARIQVAARQAHPVHQFR
jgi:hypothetical protein